MFEKEAEEYAKNEINKMFVDESEEVYVRASTLKQIIKNSYLKGFAEGEKKSEKKTSAKIKELEEENEGLKAFEDHCDEIEEDAKAIAKENAELKEKLDKIRKYLVYDIFDRFKYLENLLKIIQETQEELSKRILEQQKTIGSLTDTIDEIKAHCKAVDEVNKKMKCCGNCKHEQDSNTDYYCEDCKRFANETDIEKNGSQQNEI